MSRLIFLFLTVVWRALPPLIRAVDVALEMVFTAIISLWVGVPEARARVADEVVQKAVGRGFPIQFVPQLRQAVSFVALLVIVGGWILFAYITVWIVGMIF